MEDSTPEVSRTQPGRAYQTCSGIPTSVSISSSGSDATEHTETDTARYARDSEEGSEAELDSQVQEEPWRGSVGATRSREMLVNNLRASRAPLGLRSPGTTGKPRETKQPPAESLRRRSVLPWAREPSENWEIVDLNTPSLVDSPSELSPETPKTHSSKRTSSQNPRKSSSSRTASSRPNTLRTTAQAEDALEPEDHVSSTSEPSIIQRRRIALVNGLDQPFFSVGPHDRKTVNLSMDSSDWSGVEGLAISGSGAEGWDAEPGIVCSEEEGHEEGREERARYTRQLSKVSEENMSEGSRDEGDDADFVSVSEYTEDAEDEDYHPRNDRSFELEMDGDDGQGVDFTPRPSSRFSSRSLKRRSGLRQNHENGDEIEGPSLSPRSASTACFGRNTHSRMVSRTASDSDLSSYGDPSSPHLASMEKRRSLDSIHENLSSTSRPPARPPRPHHRHTSSSVRISLSEAYGLHEAMERAEAKERDAFFLSSVPTAQRSHSCASSDKPEELGRTDSLTSFGSVSDGGSGRWKDVGVEDGEEFTMGAEAIWRNLGSGSSSESEHESEDADSADESIETPVGDESQRGLGGRDKAIEAKDRRPFSVYGREAFYPSHSESMLSEATSQESVYDDSKGDTTIIGSGGLHEQASYAEKVDLAIALSPSPRLLPTLPPQTFFSPSSLQPPLPRPRSFTITEIDTEHVSWQSTIPDATYQALRARFGEVEMQRQENIWNLCESERLFVERLQIAVQTFIRPIRIQASRSWVEGVPPAVARLFDWLEDIFHLHSQIHRALNACRNASRQADNGAYGFVMTVADLMKVFVPRMEIYQGYVVRLGSVLRLVRRVVETGPSGNRLQSESAFGEFVRIQQSKEECQWRLERFLILPIERLVEYPAIFHVSRHL